MTAEELARTLLVERFARHTERRSSSSPPDHPEPDPDAAARAHELCAAVEDYERRHRR